MNPAMGGQAAAPRSLVIFEDRCSMKNQTARATHNLKLSEIKEALFVTANHGSNPWTSRLIKYRK
jgi:hypothetical protein